jgi:hypothetical protein
MDLVDAVEWFNSEGTQQSYWSLPDSTRDEVKKYRSATRAAREPPMPVVEEAREETQGEEAVHANEPCDDDLTQGENDLTVHQGDGQVDDDAEEDAPPPKRERSAAQKRYSDYLSIARRELKEADPSRKSIPHAEVHSHCKALLEEDGW